MKLIRASSESKAMFGKNLGFGSKSKRKQQNIDPASTIRKEGVIKEIYFVSRMPCCDVELVRGGVIKFVPFPGGKLDEITGFLHGDFIQPTVGQRVIVSFSEGSLDNPYISDLIWRPATGVSALKYKAEFPILNGEDEVVRGHKSGSRQVFRDMEVESGLDILLDPTGFAKIVQTMTGIQMGNGGGTGTVFFEVACSGVNGVITSLGPQLILLASASPGPRAGVGTFVKA